MKKISFMAGCSLLLMVSCVSNSNYESSAKSDNPLLQTFNTPFGVPPFDKIKPGDFPSAFEEAMKQENMEIDSITKCT